MAVHYFYSGLTWEQYLQVNSFVKDVRNTIRKTGREINRETGKKIKKSLNRRFQNKPNKLLLVTKHYPEIFSKRLIRAMEL